MTNALFSVPEPYNEPVRDYAPGSPERAALAAELDHQYGTKIEIPLIIGGREVRTGRTVRCVCPHEHGHALAEVHLAGPEQLSLAVEAARTASGPWQRLPWQERAAVFLKMADLIAGPHRLALNAATMLGQSKNAYQAEIDAICELADFLRYNVHFMAEIYRGQPHSPRGTWNRMAYRPLEGFVLAVTPFNFTAIAGNLPTAPAMMGNTVIWKPATTAVLSNYHLMRIFMEAGLPPGVINFLPASGAEVGKTLLVHPELAGVHFTGSTGTFQTMWRTIGSHIEAYRGYPRIVGETGGKDYIFVHPSADPQAVAVAVVRGAFEYQGQKCSAVSRIYVPESLWPDLRDRIVAMMAEIRTGDVRDFGNFHNAVIERAAFDRTMGYIDQARNSDQAEIVAGGGGDDAVGYFIQPTLIRCLDPKFVTMREEIFAPVVSAYVYEDEKIAGTLDLLDDTSPYALTGAIFARDRQFIAAATERLTHTAGNFYVNDKPTGSVVGQQPFGGARASGTNDKAGSQLNLLRWCSARSIKENFNPPLVYDYPFMGKG
ncbi:MAG: L-glutamate gamma-semialdehyde dehydrogenase [Desulfobacterales bacterium]|jgi:1-pyrroline-5-carboxylate dehydrogenase|nr:L-glutamate gamma-semialdehyde dehydrogenase [Desulfobacteraceae bacterium]MDD3992078.1 L-glutamate gamma-semialdehyde dehydrogenase [Desulfobacteraceae bacterium]MDY0311140.1 L-glutamate gamma-semialdehyde dehydrogenase [Desulfobacterales bacterium]